LTGLRIGDRQVDQGLAVVRFDLDDSLVLADFLACAADFAIGATKIEVGIGIGRGCIENRRCRRALHGKSLADARSHSTPVALTEMADHS
jgi:hypothetical protein